MAPVPEERTLLTEIAELKRRLRELEGRTLENVTISRGGLTVSGTGGIRVHDAEGDQTFFVGGLESQWTRPDGQPQSVVGIRDDDGNMRIAVWDPDPLTDDYSQQVFIWDARANLTFATAPSGGLATPQIPIPMYSRYTPPAGTIGYMHIPVTSLASAQVIWEGRISEVMSTSIEIGGTWGTAAGTNTSTYTLQVGGQTAGSWVSTSIEASTKKFDIAQWLGFRAVSVRLLVQSTGSGNAACQVNGCNLAGS